MHWLLLILALLPLAGHIFLRVRLGTRVEEFVRLLQVPMLKGDLNRVLKVCAVYNTPLSTATHGMMLKVKRPHEIDLSFHVGLHRLETHLDLQGKAAWASAITGLIVINMSGWLFLKGVLSPTWQVALAVIAVGVNLSWLLLRRNLLEQINGLYRIRNLLYSSVYKISEGQGASGTQENLLPPRYRPVRLSDEELAAWTARNEDFNRRFVERRKQPGGETLNATAEFMKEEVARHDSVPEDPL